MVSYHPWPFFVSAILTVLLYEGMNKQDADCEPLIRCTTIALDEVELQKLVVSAQQVNFDLNIEWAVR